MSAHLVMWKSLLGRRQSRVFRNIWPLSRPQIGRNFWLQPIRGFAGSAKPHMSLKQLVKQYGWTAVGVYIALSAVDLPLSFLVVHSVGPDRLNTWETKVREYFGQNVELNETYVKRVSKGKGFILAEFAVAYIIHKALIVVRLPLTVAATPTVATKLMKYGFDLDKRVPSVNREKLATMTKKKINRKP